VEQATTTSRDEVRGTVIKLFNWFLRFIPALASIFALITLPISAQTDSSSNVTISTDRPAVSASSIVVPRTGFQVENGLLLTDTQGNNVLDLPETNFRYGLWSKTELRFEAPDYFYNLPETSPGSGFGDLAAGLKQQIGPVHGFDVSAIFFLSFPTGANSISTRGYDPGLQLPWTRKLSENWTAGGQLAFYWPTVSGKHDFTDEVAFFLDRQLSKPWDAFIEYGGDFPQRGGSRQILHFGTAYKLTPHQQVDVHVAVGLSDAAPKAYFGVGYSILFLRK
jgi:Putative MetA-pathway of phenol degradation